MSIATIAVVVFLYLLVGMGYNAAVIAIAARIVSKEWYISIDAARESIKMSDGARLMYMFLWPVFMTYSLIGYVFKFLTRKLR